MRSFFVRLTCVVVNFLLGDTGPHVTAAQARDLEAARAGDPYFDAFRARCMHCVYGDDPRRALES